MVAQNMVEKGNTREQAAAEFGMLFTLLDYAQRFSVEAGTKDKGFSMQVQLQVDLP